MVQAEIGMCSLVRDKTRTELFIQVKQCELNETISFNFSKTKEMKLLETVIWLMKYKKEQKFLLFKQFSCLGLKTLKWL